MSAIGYGVYFFLWTFLWWTYVFEFFCGHILCLTFVFEVLADIYLLGTYIILWRDIYFLHILFRPFLYPTFSNKPNIVIGEDSGVTLFEKLQGFSAQNENVGLSFMAFLPINRSDNLPGVLNPLN